MHYFGPKKGVGVCPEFHGICGGAHVAHDLDANTELSAKGMVQGRWRFIQVKNKHILSVLVARVTNNQLPSCTF